MRVTVYKGFDETVLSNLVYKPLFNNEICDKFDIFKYDKVMKKKLLNNLYSLTDTADVWVTYEEYTFIKSNIDDCRDDGLELRIVDNNIYPGYYPLNFALTQEVIQEIEEVSSSSRLQDESEACKIYFKFYNTFYRVDDTYYGSFYNYEYDDSGKIERQSYYDTDIDIIDLDDNSYIENQVFVNDDVESYLRSITKILKEHPTAIGVDGVGNYQDEKNRSLSGRIFSSLKAFCIEKRIDLYFIVDQAEDNYQLESELIEIAKNDLGIQNFQSFRKIRFYRNPDFDKEVVEVSQAKIISDIICQAEHAYCGGECSYRDMFITAATGSGKSVIFQVPAVYLAKHYGKLTIIIEPIKALMQDQKNNLNKHGYKRVETFNSDLISQYEKDEVLKRIKNGEVDLLYISPETLLSYSLETIIGEREIGLIIVDEAHIVTSWGMGFRPDYWYLGSYINKLRYHIQTNIGRKRKIYKFPICAFTATAINGGLDDSVGQTIISLYMNNPIKYIGYAKRDDISFDITICEKEKISVKSYEREKTKILSKRLQVWIDNNEKTVVYFPYATMADEAYKGIKGFVGIKTDNKIGNYTGKNVNELSIEEFNKNKRENMQKFHSGELLILYATKAFGMGIDIDNIKNVYHYAASGSLCDYVQEIGRVARKQSMHGIVSTDFFYNDMTYTIRLFGMSQIKMYQIKKVISEIYNTYKNKKNRNFLISPQSFTYIFNVKGSDEKSETEAVKKLKICLLMLENDFYDEYGFKVLISRPQTIFTKAYVVIDKEKEEYVLNSKYGEFFRFVHEGRRCEQQISGALLSDIGEIYTVDLKQIWENFYKEMSFPKFKCLYFNADKDVEKIIMPEIKCYCAPRQQVNIEARNDLKLQDLRNMIIEDFYYIGDVLYDKFHKQYFKLDDFKSAITGRYTKDQATIICNALFELVDPKGRCVKKRFSQTDNGDVYMISSGNFKEVMCKSIKNSQVIMNFCECAGSTYSSYINVSDKENTALKLMSIFDYISYEIVGGEEPEIFIRLNDPKRIENIAMGRVKYSNRYVSVAREKNKRDVQIIQKFFTELNSDEERWDYIENYFLGRDVLNE